jgi:hypothetical protein
MLIFIQILSDTTRRPESKENNMKINMKRVISVRIRFNYTVPVDAFLERQILKKNRRRCLLHRGGRSARRGRTVRGLVRGAVVLSAQGRTVRGLGPDGPRPGARLGLLPDGRTVRAYAGTAEDRRRRLDLAPGRDPVGE